MHIRPFIRLNQTIPRLEHAVEKGPGFRPAPLFIPHRQERPAHIDRAGTDLHAVQAQRIGRVRLVMRRARLLRIAAEPLNLAGLVEAGIAALGSGLLICLKSFKLQSPRQCGRP